MLIMDLNFTKADKVHLVTVEKTVTTIPYLRMGTERTTNIKYCGITLHVATM